MTPELLAIYNRQLSNFEAGWGNFIAFAKDTSGAWEEQGKAAPGTWPDTQLQGPIAPALPRSWHQWVARQVTASQALLLMDHCTSNRQTRGWAWAAPAWPGAWAKPNPSQLSRKRTTHPKAGDECSASAQKPPSPPCSSHMADTRPALLVPAWDLGQPLRASPIAIMNQLCCSPPRTMGFLAGQNPQWLWLRNVF